MRDFQSFDRRKVAVSPSLLAADFGNLEAELTRVTSAGVEILHLDVMDGHFVPNISFGIPVLKSLRPRTELFFDTHLMISHPAFYLEKFVAAGSDLVTFHLESDDDPETVIAEAKRVGVPVGISLKPKTPAEAIFPYLDKIDLVLVMTVEPGFGGQSFMSDQLPKIAAIKREILRRELPVTLEVDGGIDGRTAPQVIAAGAHLLVAGTAFFRHSAGAQVAAAELTAAGNLLDSAI